MKSRYRKALIIVCSSLLSILVLVLVTTAAILIRPDGLINSKTVGFAIRHYLGKSYHPSWSDLQISIRSLRWNEKEILFSTKGFCFKKTDQSIDGCFDQVSANLRLSILFPELYRIQEISHLVVNGRYLTMDSRLQSTSGDKKKSNSFFKMPKLYFPMPRWKTKMQAKSWDLKFSDVKWINPDQELTGTIRARAVGEGDNQTLEIRADGLQAKLVQRTPFTIKLILNSDLLSKGELTYIDAQTEFRGGKNHGILHFRAQQKSLSRAETHATAESDLLFDGKSFNLKLVGDSTRSELSIRGEASAFPFRSRIQLESFSIRVPLRDDETPKNAEMDVPFQVGWPGQVLQISKGLEGTLHLSSDFQVKEAEPDSFLTRVDLKSASKNSDSLSYAIIQIHADTSGRLGDLPESLRYGFHADIDVKKFEEFVRRLKNTPLAVPAPLHVLQGPIHLTVDSDPEVRGVLQKVTFQLMTELQSRRQKFISSGTGEVSLLDPFKPSQQIRLQAKVDLNEIKIELPYLKPQDSPHLSVDKRIRANISRKMEPDSAFSSVPIAKPKESVGHSVQYRVDVNTPQKPIILLSNLAKDPIPLRLNMRFTSDENPSGQIQVEKTRLEIFHQIAEVEYVKLIKHSDSKFTGLTGLITYKRPEVLVKIILAGTLEKPTVNFESEPPLKKDQIIALLLFGKSPSQLDSDQQATVGQIGPALASGSFGLASLYLLGSTPIDYVGYDPATQSYAIRFRLPHGATLQVGSDLSESATLSLRKRLSPHWMIETEFKRELEAQQSRITTFIDWFRQF